MRLCCGEGGEHFRPEPERIGPSMRRAGSGPTAVRRGTCSKQRKAAIRTRRSDPFARDPCRAETGQTELRHGCGRTLAEAALGDVSSDRNCAHADGIGLPNHFHARGEFCPEAGMGRDRKIERRGSSPCRDLASMSASRRRSLGVAGMARRRQIATI